MPRKPRGFDDVACCGGAMVVVGFYRGGEDLLEGLFEAARRLSGGSQKWTQMAEGRPRRRACAWAAAEGAGRAADCAAGGAAGDGSRAGLGGGEARFNCA